MFANVPPKVIVPVDVIVPPVKVSPFTVPAVATDVTVPPDPAAAISTPPAVFVIVTPVPAVRVDNTGSAPVLPITN